MPLGTGDRAGCPSPASGHRQKGNISPCSGRSRFCSRQGGRLTIRRPAMHRGAVTVNGNRIRDGRRLVAVFIEVNERADFPLLAEPIGGIVVMGGV